MKVHENDRVHCPRKTDVGDTNRDLGRLKGLVERLESRFP